MMIAILVVYFGLMLFVGYLASRKVRDSRDYFLGGKGFGPWFTAFKFAATWESGVKLVGSPGMAWNAGWSSLAMGIGTPLCYFFSFRVFGQRLKLAFDHFHVLTLPQMLEKRYKSRTIRVIAAIAILIGLGGSLVAQFKATGEIFSTILGLDYLSGLIIGAVVVGVYCVMGGYLASVWTDFIQGIIMVLGSIAIFTATAQAAFGGLSLDLLPQLNAALGAIDPNLLDVTGGGKMSWSNLFIILAITMLVGIAMPQQSVAIFFHARRAHGQSGHDRVRGVLRHSRLVAGHHRHDESHGSGARGSKESRHGHPSAHSQGAFTAHGRRVSRRRAGRHHVHGERFHRGGGVFVDGGYL